MTWIKPLGYHNGTTYHKAQLSTLHNPMWSCAQEIETSTHFVRHCPNYHCPRKPSLKKIDSNTLKQNKQLITKLFLFDKKKLKVVQDKSILTSTIDFLQATNRDLRPRYLIKCLIGMVPSRHLHVQS